MGTVKPISLKEKLSSFDERWTPKIVADLNDHEIKVVKLEGAFEWHSHDNTDEMFLVIAGTLRMKFRNNEEVLQAGDMIVVPKDVEHLPVAEPFAEAIIVERQATLNTGDAGGDRTVPNPERI